MNITPICQTSLQNKSQMLKVKTVNITDRLPLIGLILFHAI